MNMQIIIEKLRLAGAYLLARGQEPSTWRGLTLVATASGAMATPDQREAIITGGVLVAGLIGAMFPDKRQP